MLFPRWLAPLNWTVGLLLAHVAMPYWLSTFSVRHGWSAGRPGLLNLSSLTLVCGGFLIIVSALVEHFKSAPHGWEIKMTPDYLIIRGPYRSSRNPMYVAALTTWSGWALFYGSVAVIVGVLVLWAIIALVVIPSEERRLEAAWGEPYLQYKSRVSRWFGRVQG
jgi:protein-S-isoprenylcysteine O-methyltransferase Ste14